MHQRKLPENFDQTMNNKFGFIMRNAIGDNYNVSIKGMNAYDIAQINQSNGKGTVLLNASKFIREKTWYKVKAVMTENEATIALYYINGTLIENISLIFSAIAKA